MTDRAPLAIACGARTPFVRAFGAALGATADDLAVAVFREVLARAAVDPGRLDQVILGCAGQPVEAMNVARVAALRAGVPARVPALSVHRNCASGMEAVDQALLRLRAGAGDLFLVGGAEAMSEAPFQLAPGARRKLIRALAAKGARRLRRLLALRPGDLLARETLRTSLTDPTTALLMGDTAELLAREFAIAREAQDAFALVSQQRAAAARDAGRFGEEIVPFFVPPDYRTALAADDGIRADSSPAKLERLRPVFDRRHGSVTVGNSCQISDGAAALLVGGRERLAALGLPALALVKDVVTVGLEPDRMGLGPALAIPPLLERHGLGAAHVDLWEINEAFAVQVLACLKSLGPAAPPAERLNVNGGAIALGHPVGATGTRLILTLALELRRRGLARGVAALCVGGGQGVAVLLENPEARGR